MVNFDSQCQKELENPSRLVLFTEILPKLEDGKHFSANPDRFPSTFSSSHVPMSTFLKDSGRKIDLLY